MEENLLEKMTFIQKTFVYFYGFISDCQQHVYAAW